MWCWRNLIYFLVLASAGEGFVNNDLGGNILSPALFPRHDDELLLTSEEPTIVTPAADGRQSATDGISSPLPATSAPPESENDHGVIDRFSNNGNITESTATPIPSAEDVQESIENKEAEVIPFSSTNTTSDASGTQAPTEEPADDGISTLATETPNGDATTVTTATTNPTQTPQFKLERVTILPFQLNLNTDVPNANLSNQEETLLKNYTESFLASFYNESLSLPSIGIDVGVQLDSNPTARRRMATTGTSMWKSNHRQSSFLRRRKMQNQVSTPMLQRSFSGEATFLATPGWSAPTSSQLSIMTESAFNTQDGSTAFVQGLVAATRMDNATSTTNLPAVRDGALSKVTKVTFVNPNSDGGDEGTSPSPPLPAPNRTGAIAGGVVGGLAGLFMAAFVWKQWRANKKKRESSQKKHKVNEVEDGGGQMPQSAETAASATPSASASSGGLQQQQQQGGITADTSTDTLTKKPSSSSASLVLPPGDKVDTDPVKKDNNSTSSTNNNQFDDVQVDMGDLTIPHSDTNKTAEESIGECQTPIRGNVSSRGFAFAGEGGDEGGGVRNFPDVVASDGEGVRAPVNGINGGGGGEVDAIQTPPDLDIPTLGTAPATTAEATTTAGTTAVTTAGTTVAATAALTATAAVSAEANSRKVKGKKRLKQKLSKISSSSKILSKPTRKRSKYKKSKRAASAIELGAANAKSAATRHASANAGADDEDDSSRMEASPSLLEDDGSSVAPPSTNQFDDLSSMDVEEQSQKTLDFEGEVSLAGLSALDDDRLNDVLQFEAAPGKSISIFAQSDSLDVIKPPRPGPVIRTDSLGGGGIPGGGASVGSGVTGTSLGTGISGMTTRGGASDGSLSGEGSLASSRSSLRRIEEKCDALLSEINKVPESQMEPPDDEDGGEEELLPPGNVDIQTASLKFLKSGRTVSDLTEHASLVTPDTNRGSMLDQSVDKEEKLSLDENDASQSVTEEVKRQNVGVVVSNDSSANDTTAEPEKEPEKESTARALSLTKGQITEEDVVVNSTPDETPRQSTGDDAQSKSSSPGTSSADSKSAEKVVDVAGNNNNMAEASKVEEIAAK